MVFIIKCSLNQQTWQLNEDFSENVFTHSENDEVIKKSDDASKFICTYPHERFHENFK